MLKTSLIFSACVLQVTLSQEYEYDYVSECPEENGFFADAVQCDRYYECQLGEVSEKLCPDGLVFDESSHGFAKCGHPFSIDCEGRPELQPAQSSEFCPRLNGYFAHPDPTDCTTFYFCNDGIPNEISCPGGLVFDPSLGQCGYTDQVKRKGCRSKDLFNFQCPNQDKNNVDHSRHEDPEKCTEFFLCIGGQPRKSGCSAGLVYSHDTTSCQRQSTLDDLHRCRNHFNQTYLDEVLPKPTTRRPPSQEQVNLANRRKEFRRRPQAQSNSRQPPVRTQQVSAPAPSKPDFSDLPPQLQALAGNSDLGFRGESGFSDSFNSGLSGSSGSRFAGTGRNPSSSNEEARFASNIQTAGGSRFNDDNAGSGFNDDNDSRFNSFQEEPKKVFEEVDERVPSSGFGSRPRNPQSRVPPRVVAQREEAVGSAFNDDTDSRLDIQNLGSLGPSELDAFLTRTPQQNSIPLDTKPSEPATTTTAPTGFGLRRRVPLSGRGGRPRNQPGARPQQPEPVQEEEEAPAKKRFNNFRRGGLPPRRSQNRDSSDESESTGRISSNSQRRRVRPSRPEQSFTQQTEDLGGSSSDRDSVSARRSQGGRLEVTKANNLPPLQKFVEEDFDFETSFSNFQQSRGRQG